MLGNGTIIATARCTARHGVPLDVRWRIVNFHCPSKSLVKILTCIIVCIFQEEPFTSHLPETLFNIARYLLHLLIREIPIGVSRVYPFCHVNMW